MKKIILLFLLCIPFLSQLVYGHECAPTPAPWFNIEISVDKTTLPEGVTFKANTDYPEYKKRYVVENITDTPLFIIIAEKDAGTVTFLSSPDTLTNLPFRIDLSRIYWIFRVQKGVNYYYHWQWNHETGYRGEWKTDQLGTSIYSKAFIDIGDLEAIGIKTKQIARDNRPSDTIVPSPQNFSFTVYYGNQPKAIKGVLSYSLNNSYNPNGEKESFAQCEKMLLKF